ncbi:MAG: hypothetical protein RR131_02885 [Anaerovorax sp.]
MKTLTITASNVEQSYAILLHHCHHIRQHSQLVASGRWANSTDFCFWAYDQIELLHKKFFIVGNQETKKASSSIAKSLGMVEADCREHADIILLYHI